VRIRHNIYSITIVLFVLSILVFTSPARAQSDDTNKPIVHAVLFYSPTCPACKKVITQDLPPLLEKYDDQLYIIGVDVSVEIGQYLYREAIEVFEIPEDRLGVPTLIVGDIVLVGSAEIPGLFPGIIEDSLTKEGIDWPQLPTLLDQLEQQAADESTEVEDTSEEEQQQAEQENTYTPTSETEQEIQTTEPTQESESAEEDQSGSESITAELDSASMPKVNVSMLERFQQDIPANTISVIVLIGMVISIIIIIVIILNPERWHLSSWPTWVIPLLSIIGLGVALYLSYIEITQEIAVCGPVGDCNAVQESPYARLFGFLPVGVLGAAGYILIFFAWMLTKYGPINIHAKSNMAMWGMAVFGTMFSIYLTFLEPFVIGATCAWCLSSAIIITLLMWASTPLVIKEMVFDG
jgi:uncharacterized membrane protein